MTAPITDLIVGKTYLELQSLAARNANVEAFDIVVVMLRHQAARTNADTGRRVADLDAINRAIRARHDMDGVPDQNWGELWDFVTL